MIRYAARLVATFWLNFMLGPASFALLFKWWVNPTTNPNDWRVWTPEDAHEYRYGQYLGAMFGPLGWTIAAKCMLVNFVEPNCTLTCV